MQIVIDIPDEDYEDVKKAGGCYYDFGKAIYYGVPLDKIRAEIEQIHSNEFEVSDVHGIRYKYATIDKAEVLQIIDKYRKEDEE